MKAKDLDKKELTIEEIRKAIKEANEQGQYKHLIPHWLFVSESIIAQLISDGFKVYRGDWDLYAINALIIEW